MQFMRSATTTTHWYHEMENSRNKLQIRYPTSGDKWEQPRWKNGEETRNTDLQSTTKEKCWKPYGKVDCQRQILWNVTRLILEDHKRYSLDKITYVYYIIYAHKPLHPTFFMLLNEAKFDPSTMQVGRQSYSSPTEETLARVWLDTL